MVGGAGLDWEVGGLVFVRWENWKIGRLDQTAGLK